MSRVPKVNEKIFIKSRPEYSPPDGKWCKVMREALGLVWVRPKNWRGEDLEIDINDIIYIEPETLSSTERATIVKKLVKPEFLMDRQNYYIQLGVMNKLLAAFPNLDFWRNFNPGYQVKSLLWFLGGGKNQLRYDFNAATLDFSTKKSTISSTMTNEAVVESVEVKQKPKTLLDL